MNEKFGRQVRGAHRIAQEGRPGRRPKAITALVATAVLVVTSLLVGNPLPASATGTATITVHAGGDRSGTSTVKPLSGVTFQAVQGATTSGSPVAATCTTDSTGTCSLTGLATNTTYTVSETGVPTTDWYRNPTLDEGDSSTGHSAPYKFVATTGGNNSTTDVPGASLNGGSYVYDKWGDKWPGYGSQDISGQNNGSPWTGLMSASRNDPSLAPLCGLKIALILDSSGSMGDYVDKQNGITKLDNLQTAAKSVISALTGTPTQVAIYSFADSAGSSVSLTPLTDTATEQPLINKINGLSANGGTNWDQGIYQAVTSSKTYDLAIILTDGNPTTDNQGTGGSNTTNFHNVDNAIFSANALKALGTRIVTVGIGVNGGEENIRAISGPNVNSDYYLATNQNFGDIFKSLATGNCTNALTVQKKIEDSSGNVLTNSTDANGWQFSGSISAGSTIGSFPATASQSGTTGLTQASVNIPSSATPTVTVTEALKSGYTIDWAKTTCTVDGKTVTTSKVGDGTANPGVSFTGKANVAMSCTFTNKQPAPAQLTLVKQVNDPSGNPVTGADVSAFTLSATGSSGSFSGTANTAAVTSKPVTGGVTYTLAENTVTGYNNGTSWSCKVTSGGGTLTQTAATVTPGAGQNITCTIVNTQKSTSLTVKKTDDGGNPLTGAKFELHKGSATGTTMGTCTTGADGTCSVNGLGFGTYYWVETVAPAGYELPSSPDNSFGPVVISAGNAGTTLAATVVKDSATPVATVKKTVSSLAQNADGSWTVVYDLAVTNSDQKYGTTYSLTDTLGFLSGFTVTSKSVAGPGASGSWTGVAPNTTVATNQSIAKNTTVHYTVTVTGTIALGSIAANGTCTASPGTAGHGLFNSTTITSAAGGNTSTACATPVSPTITKTAGTPTQHLVGGVWDGSWDVPYTITVNNPSASAGLYYSLTDAPDLASSLVVGSATVSGTGAGGAIPSGASGDNKVLTTWNGSSSTTIITKRPLGAGATDTYSVTINVSPKLGSTVTSDDLTCATKDTPDRGAYNKAIVNSGNDSSSATACANLPKLATVKVLKTDAVTGKALAGATFALWAETNGTPDLQQTGASPDTLIKTCTTDGTGACSVSNVAFGTYYWVETAAPTGYQLPSPNVFSTTVSTAGSAITTTVADPQTPSTLTVKKTDENGNPLAGATFELHKDSSTGATVNSCTTGVDGTCSVGNLPFGTYYWVETKAPAGYQLPASNSFGPVVVSAGNAGTPIATTVVKDTQAPTTLTVTKTDENGNPLAGATFELHQGADGTGKLLYTCTTGANGACTVSVTPVNGNVVGFGTYSWLETVAPTGYQLPSPKVFATTVDATNAGGTLTTTVKDPQAPSTLTVKKTDENGNPLSGATFALWRESNGVAGLQQGAPADTNLGSCTTVVGSGTCSIGSLPFGTYYWVETVAPTGYQLSGSAVSDPIVIAANNAGTPIAATVVKDVQQPTTLTVKKTDENGNPLAGATFELHQDSSTGATVNSCTTGVDGTCSVSNVAFGTYYWVEKTAPTGYQLPASNSFGPVVVSAGNAGTPIAATVVKDVQQPSTLTVKKTDESGNALSGATFALWRESNGVGGLQQGAPADTYVDSCTTSGAAGTCALTGLPFGTYYWVETAAPTGYQLSGSAVSDPIVIAANNAGTPIAATVVKDAQQPTTLTVTKTDDSNPPKPLAGATFELSDSTGKVLYTCTTDTTGACTVSVTGSNVVGFGTYTWTETKAPANYQLSDPVSQTVTVDANNAGKTNVVTFSDSPTPVATVVKTVSSLAQNADGSWTVVYDLAVTNASTKYATTYDVTDTLGFLSGFTVTSATVSGPGASGSWTGVAPNTAVATSQSIAKNTTVHYTVTVTGTIALGSIAANGACTASPGTAGHGLFNSTTITSAGGTNTDTACASPVSPTITKTAGTPTRHLVGGVWDGSWDVPYTITVNNPSASAGLYYSLTDAPDLAATLDFGNATVSGTDNAGHAIPSGTSDDQVLTSWTGKSPNTTIITKRPLPANATDTYAVTINVTNQPASQPSSDDLTCATTDTPDRGAYNKAIVTSGNDSPSATACASLPQLPVPAISKSVTSTTQNPDGTWTIVYKLSVDNSKGTSGTYYALSDTPRFGGGITVLSASMTGPNDDAITVAGWDPLHGSSVVTKDQALGAGKTDVYTVTITADVATKASTTDRDCSLDTTENGTGFLNTADLQSGYNSSTATACSSPSTATITKTFVSATQHVSGGAWDGTWDVVYTLKVNNPGSTGLLYTLDDAPAYPAGVSVNSEAVVGPNGAANAWNGTGHIVHNQPLAAGQTDTYTVTVNATISSATSAADRACQTDTAGKGLYNAATVTSGHDSSTAHDCGDIPTPGVPTVAKTVTSNVQNPDGTWTVTYDLAVTNGSGRYASPYNLTDTLQFGGGISVISATVSGPGASGSWTGVAPNTVVASGIPMAPGASVHYTVTATAKVATTATATDRDCTLDTGETGTGFLNTATVSSSGGGNTATACASPGSPTVVKKVVSAVEGPQWHWVINYSVTVTNSTQDQVSYSLTDTPDFASGMSITSTSVVHQRTAADGSKVGSSTTVAGWTGVAPHESLADGVTLPAGNTDTYYVTVGALIDEHIDTTLLACSAAGAGHGFFNAATMTSGDDVTHVSACAPGKAHGVGGVTTSQAPPSHGTSPQPPLATTGSNVWLVGAVGILLVAIGGLMVLGTMRRRHH